MRCGCTDEGGCRGDGSVLDVAGEEKSEGKSGVPMRGLVVMTAAMLKKADPPPAAKDDN
jgi:hypothetical protein